VILKYHLVGRQLVLITPWWSKASPEAMAKLTPDSSYQWLLSDPHLTQLIVLLSIFSSSYFVRYAGSTSELGRCTMTLFHSRAMKILLELGFWCTSSTQNEDLLSITWSLCCIMLKSWNP
jgi:hypothetical protein